MISRTDILAFVQQLVRQLRPRSVILFGSYADGTPTDDSDVDPMVIMPQKGSSADVATKIRLACPRNFSMDLMVRSPPEIRRRIKMGDSFLRQVTSKGIVVHETRNPRKISFSMKTASVSGT